MYCGKDISSYDLVTTQENDVIDCTYACSMNRPPCYGVSFSTITGTCFLKNSSVTLDHMVAADGSQSALARSSQLAPIDTGCPYLSNSYQTTADGMEFEILCGLDMDGYGDYCPDNAATCPKHTDTMEECLEYCSISHPLCLGVSWNPDMVGGYPNCYLKNDPSAGTPAPLWRDFLRRTSPAPPTQHISQAIARALNLPVTRAEAAAVISHHTTTLIWMDA
jgi:hypothetical protein